ncbi:MAG: hypothetical protein EHM12_03915 [Dehalococcoidia bacterium]|nr:MAG: hypothetical protein EHM12_03915 [Dehalococcoidia bacterium]
MTIIIPLIIVTVVLAWILRPGKIPAKSCKIAILATTIPPLAAAMVAIIFQVVHNLYGLISVSDISNTCFIVTICLVGGSILAAVVFVIARNWEIAKGIGFGICMGVLISVIELAVLEWLAGV